MGLTKVEDSSLLLDQKLLRFMDQLELLEEKRTALNSLIEEGWFSISKARYSMGNKHVSPLQYASEMEPLVCVHARPEDGDVDFCIERVKQKCNNEAGRDARPVEDIGPHEEGVRRRIKPKKHVTEKEASEEASERDPEITPVRKRDQDAQQDPLRWFGILVPQSLKQAQSSFKQVIELSAEIATLQTAVLNTRQELSHIMKDKHILQEEASAAQVDKVED